jgi:hypothetical protein
MLQASAVAVATLGPFRPNKAPYRPEVLPVPDWIKPILDLTTTITDCIHFLVSHFADFLYHVNARTVEIKAGYPIAVAPNTPIEAPVGATLKVQGTYWIRPKQEEYYVVFVRQNTKYWPQGPLNFHGRRSWDSSIYFGEHPGQFHVIIARISSEAKLLFDYYWVVQNHLKSAKLPLTKQLGQSTHLLRELPFWRSIDSQRMPGLTNLDDLVITLRA